MLKGKLARLTAVLLSLLMAEQAAWEEDDTYDAEVKRIFEIELAALKELV